MKIILYPITALSFLSAIPALAQPASVTDGESPPVSQVPAAAAVSPAGGEQQLYFPGNETLIPSDQARAVIEKFKAAYARLGSPRLSFYVNRELVDTESGLKLTRRTERTEAVRGEIKSDVESPASAGRPQTQVNVSVGGSAGATATTGKGTTSRSMDRVTGDNTYEAKNASLGTLADRQTVRDVERLFGRPFRSAGAMLADQKAAAALVADREWTHLAAAGGDVARKDREALAKVADVVIEVLISSRPVTAPLVSGDVIVAVPDIQATAIRLGDFAILGQASSRDVLGKDRDASRIVPRFDASDIAEATALALMEDMTLGAR